ncbi:hypothetical protein ZEAMMB73_Zm00001d038383 [Zea mays]|nr:hypothetical protein ZEAMMB73_Zm00001d038383 [Zea mays]AQK86497.1 hypothetical protein ZEAMMB73_Zm00001d038383 [Zea mays]AQK86498.1 hypothetical protein ZEAMMB73_Zm00001d038383 [Zea mays]AQK86500.1 hypothetical protein ZEAMMB73_Zm00001d038383 [Zea mays]AQK86501.1 hypothetical protein ZEAMMB73_Zm00001d038383 [Zea mays]
MPCLDQVLAYREQQEDAQEQQGGGVNPARDNREEDPGDGTRRGHQRRPGGSTVGDKHERRHGDDDRRRDRGVQGVLLRRDGDHVGAATWTMVVLSMHPEWQDRAREEVTALFGRDGKPEYDGLSRLKVVTMVLYEVLRLYPSATSVVRQTYKEMEVGGVTYPAGVILELPVLLIHHDPDIWGGARVQA